MIPTGSSADRGKRPAQRGSRDRSSRAVAWSWPYRAGRGSRSGDYLIDRKPTDLPAEALDHGISYISQAKGSFVAVIDGSKWIGLDPATGRPRGPSIELGFAPILPIHYADLDGDGSAEILALERGHLAGGASNP